MHFKLFKYTCTCNVLVIFAEGCPQRFKHRSNIAYHLESHKRKAEEALKPKQTHWECETCQKVFTSWQGLGAHQRIHTPQDGKTFYS